MKAVTKLLTGAAGVAALTVAAAPASAQIYNPYGGGGNVVGQILQTVLNPYGAQQQYGYRQNSQALVNQCAAAVQGQLAQRYSAGYNQYGAGYGGYNGYNGYNNAYSSARVVGIRSVERRSSTTTRVRGYASSGMAMNYGGYGGYGGYGQPQAQADLTFKCDVDYRGYIRDIDINRR